MGRLDVGICDLLLQTELLVFRIGILTSRVEDILFQIGIGIADLVAVQIPHNRVGGEGSQGPLALGCVRWDDFKACC